MGLHDLVTKHQQSQQLEFGGDFVTAAVPIPRETDRLYTRTAEHIAVELSTSEFPKEVIMGAVLATPVEADLVLGFINGDLEVVSQSTASQDLLRDEIDALDEGRWELTPLGVKREQRDAAGRTRLQRYKAANPALVSRLQALDAEQKLNLILEYMMSVERARGILPRYLKALAQKIPERYAQIVKSLSSAKTRHAERLKAAQRPKYGPKF